MILPCIAADILSALLLQAIVSRAFQAPSSPLGMNQGPFEKRKESLARSRLGNNAPSQSTETDSLAENMDKDPPEMKNGLPSGRGSGIEESTKDAAGVLFLMNPYTIAACVGGSTSSIENCVVLLALHGAIEGQ